MPHSGVFLKPMLGARAQAAGAAAGRRVVAPRRHKAAAAPAVPRAPRLPTLGAHGGKKGPLRSLLWTLFAIGVGIAAGAGAALGLGIY